MWCILCEPGVSQMFLSVSFLTLVLHKMLLTVVCFSKFESLQRIVTAGKRIQMLFKIYISFFLSKEEVLRTLYDFYKKPNLSPTKSEEDFLTFVFFLNFIQ